MTLDLERSLVYDTIRFFDIFFNYKEIEEDIIKRNLEPDKCLESYHMLVPEKEIDQDLYVFFALNKNSMSLLSRIYFENIHTIRTLQDLYEIISEEDKFKPFCVDYYFGENHGDNTAEMDRKYVYRLDIPSNIKVSLFALLIEYKELVRSLLDTLEVIASEVRRLYEKYAKKISLFRLDPTHIQVLEEISNIQFTDHSVYYISLLHPHGYRLSKSKNIDYWLFGLHCKHTIENEYRYLNVTHTSAASILSNDMMMEVVNIISQHEEINPAEIIKNLNEEYVCSPASIYRIITNLLAEKVITVSNKTSKNVYYRLNREYFRYAKAAVEKILIKYVS